ncbi:MAG: glucose 1-dehydrogenase [Candidatus Binatia bacterium]|nr:glucose 1-dehydrogenase [Candidatus Binatia bacterium]
MGDELLGKVAIVTGGSSGIGRATAELFVEEGAKVVVADVDVQQGERVVAGLGDAAVFQRTDVSDADDVRALVDFAVGRFGGLNVMFNNAGVSGAKPTAFLDDDLQDFEHVIGVNLLGVMVGSQAAAQHMAQNGGGSIINTASIAALMAGGAFLTYRASKAAVIHFSRSIAVELGEHGIRVNCIAPGHIPTGMTSYDMNVVIELTQPVQKQGTARDVAQAALYLASERAALVTGMVLPVDGGTNVGAPPGPFRELAAARMKARAR